MRNLSSVFLALLLLVISSKSYGQMEDYNYIRELQGVMREIKGVEQSWHFIPLPNELYARTTQELSDIRIYGITEDSDTIEVPYVLESSSEETTTKELRFTTLNESQNEKGYYYTIELANDEPIDQITLDFSKQNFDWRVTLEGSQDQKEWFRIIEDERLLSIKNDQTDFQFTTLTFPRSSYRFYRILVNSEEDPGFRVASIVRKEVVEGSYRDHAVKEFTTNQNKTTNQTEIEVDLGAPARVSYLKVNVADSFDYYRPVSIMYLADSFNTEKGWKYSYKPLASGTLNSLEDNTFHFESKTTRVLKVVISDHDNEALNIGSLEVKGYSHHMIARFSTKATYYLTYGNNKATRPQYDIGRFIDKVSEVPAVVEVGAEVPIDKTEAPRADPLFENEAWLWAVMGVVIALLGWFTLKMMGKQ